MSVHKGYMFQQYIVTVKCPKMLEEVVDIYLPLKDEAQTALFKGPVRTTL
jgi:hypothetical protein